MEKIISYRDQLNTVFKSRIEKNRQYSLRAFARDLSLDPGQLSLVLKGKKNISLSKASEISKVLFASSREMVLFFHSVEFELATSEDVKQLLKKKIAFLSEAQISLNTNISEDEFEIISNWYNIPLLELTGIKDFAVTSKFAAEYFGISDLEAMLGLEALTRLGFVKKAGQKFTRLKHLTTTTEIPSLAIKRYHQQMMAKATHALFQQDIKKRYFSGVTLSIPGDKIDELKKMIVEHEQRLKEFALSLKAESNQVIYQASTQLFSLSANDSKSL